jgi:uncharacterized repeat protein (TIGR03803 family)
MNTPTQLRRCILAIFWLVAGLALLLVLSVVAARSAQAQTYDYSLLHSFTGSPDGFLPLSGLVLDAQGNLYGTTLEGGIVGCFTSCGIVFKIDTGGNESIFYSFLGPPTDGSYPWGTLTIDAQGNLYGTTSYGGAYGNGAVFKIDPTGNESVLYSFGDSPDGANPLAGVVLDASGNLYGTTEKGGAQNLGTVYKLEPSGVETVLHSFSNNPDGDSPWAGVALDAHGNLYGTTLYGGSGSGTVFEVDAAGQESVLYSFTGKVDGDLPSAGLALDSLGNLYGTTSMGGVYKRGTVFKLDTDGHETVLHSFDTRNGDGEYPNAGVVLDSQNNLYGTTYSGPGGLIHGTVYRLDTAGNETILYRFGRKGGGLKPMASPVLDALGNVYGTTYEGGTSDDGTVFRLLSSASATSTTLSSAPNPSLYGESVTFTAVVNGDGGAPPDGETVSFMKSKTLLGTGTLIGGSATFTTAGLAVGTTKVTAVYGGDLHRKKDSSKILSQIVKQPKD